MELNSTLIKHGGLDRDHLPLTYPDKPLDLTLISVVSNVDEIHQLYRGIIRWDLVTKWLLVVVKPTNMPAQVYHPKIKWSAEWVDKVDTENPRQVLTVTDLPGYVVFHQLDHSNITPNFWPVFEHITTYQSHRFISEPFRLTDIMLSPDDVTKHKTSDSWIDVLIDFNSAQLITVPTEGPAISEQLHNKINHITIDTSNSLTPLCYYAGQFYTDKSPHHVNLYARHAYTGLYHLLFRHLRRNPIVLAEIGVLEGHSLTMWHDYFHHESKMVAMDYEVKFLDKVVADSKQQVDVHDETSIIAGLSRGLDEIQETAYDVILDDSSHTLRGQLHFIRAGLAFLKPGGIMVIEDIFKQIPISHFQDIIDEQRIIYLKQGYDLIVDFYHTNHNLKNSYNWDNDAILVITKYKI